MSQPFVARPLLRNFYWMGGVSLVFAVMFGLMALGDESDDLSHRLVAWGGTALFAYCTVLAVLRARRRAPFLEIDATGIAMPRLPLSIPWTEFTRAEIIEWKRYPLISLTFADVDALADKNLRGMIELNRNCNFPGDIAMGTKGSDRRFDELVAAVRTYAPQLLRD